MDGIDEAEGLNGSVLIIGFGRFGQVAQPGARWRAASTSRIIDNDTEMIRAAGEFGFKVYYGDGTRLDVLHATGAGTGAGHPGLRRQAGRRATASSSWCRRVPAGACSCAPTTAATRWS